MSLMGDIDRSTAIRVTEICRELARRQRQRLFFHMYPSADEPMPKWCDQIEGGDENVIYARDKYPKHLEFFEAGAQYRERCFRAANRVGKTLGGGGYELAAHLTGQYPDWWTGRRFEKAVRCWAAGKTNETTRDILQRTLLGDIIYEGSRKRMDGFGIVPGEMLGDIAWKQGVADLVDTIKVRHISGGWSRLGLKSYQQGRGSFEGTAQHVILLDEEPPLDIYGECLIRTATTKGLLMLTFTPLEGMSEVVMQFMPQEMRLEAAGA